MVTPYSILAVGGAASISPGNAFFIVLTAAIVENLLFVNTLAPTLGKWLGNNLVAAVIVSATAAVFHYAAYGADPASMLAAFVFFFAMIVLNSYTRTTGTGFSAHAVNNAAVIIGMGV